VSHLQATMRHTLRRIGRAVIYSLAAVYLIIDLALLSFIRPLRHRLLGSGRVHAWIEGLNRYVALSLVLVPLAILEPVKPVAFYLTAKGHVLSGGVVLGLGEIIKVTLVEQVIEITKPKLMSFRWFAWAYGHWEAVMDRLRSIEAWQAVRRQFHTIVARVRRIKAQMETR
jgi:hypothetical protein